MVPYISLVAKKLRRKLELSHAWEPFFAQREADDDDAADG